MCQKIANKPNNDDFLKDLLLLQNAIEAKKTNHFSKNSKKNFSAFDSRLVHN